MVIISIIGGWSTAASTHIIGILPMINTMSQTILITITTSEYDLVSFTISSSLNESIVNGSVTAFRPTIITDSTLLSYTVSSESDRHKGILVTTGSEKKISVTVAMTYSGSVINFFCM